MRWRSGTEDGGYSVVIDRRTPGGMLVVRRAGDSGGREYKFKWSEHAAKYQQTENRTYYDGVTRELRDVPAEYIPSCQVA